MKTPFSNNLISTKEASEISGYSSGHLARLARLKEVRGTRVGRTWLVERESLERFMKKNGRHKKELAGLISTKEASKLYGYSSDYVARIVRSGEVKGTRVGRTWLVERESLAIFIQVLGQRKEMRARELARARGEEYLFAQNLQTPLIVIHPQFMQATLRSRMFAFSIALLVIIFGTFTAQPVVVSRLTEKTVTLANDVAFGFHATFGNIPSRVVAKIDAMSIEMRTHTVSPPRTALDFSSLRLQTAFQKNTLTRIVPLPPLVSPSNLLRATHLLTASELISEMNLALGESIIEASHTAIRADVAMAYNLVAFAPRIAQTVFGAEYAIADRFLTLTNAISENYLAFVLDTGRFAYEIPASGIALTHRAGSLLARAPATLAAVLPALSVGEQTALFTYQTVHNFFNSATGMFASLFGTSHIAVVSNPPSTVLPFGTSTMSFSEPQPTAPPTIPAPSPRITVTNYPTYTTVVKGVSEDFMNQSLASLRSGILATVAGMIQPVASQGMTNLTTIQQVNMIQDLSDLIVRNGDFRGGVFDSGTVSNAISVSATTGSFSNLTATTLGVGTSSPSDTLAVAGPIYLADSSPASVTNRLYSSSGDLYWGGSLVGGGSVGNWVLASGNVYRSSGNVGIGTSSPFAMLSVVGETVSSYFTATSTTATTTLAGGLNVGSGGLVYDRSTGYVGIGTLIPENLLDIKNISGNASVGIQAINNGSAYLKLTEGADLEPGLTDYGGMLKYDGGSNPRLEIGTFFNDAEVPVIYIPRNQTNVGIGTTSPYAKLSVAGNGFFNGNLNSANLTATGTLTVSGNTTLANATSTNFSITNLLSSLLKTNSSGSVITATAGTDYLAPSSLTATYPIQYSTNNFSLAFGTTTANTWAGTQTFTNAPILSSITSTGLAVDSLGVVYGAATTTFNSPLAYVAGAVSIPAANGSTNGYLASGDWTTFNNKQATMSATWPITLSGATLGWNGLSTSTALSSGQIDFSTGVNTIGNDSNFFWDTTNKRLGIGTTSPYSMLSVAGQVVGQNFIAASTTATSTFAGDITIANSASAISSGDYPIQLKSGATGATAGYVFIITNNLLDTAGDVLFDLKNAGTSR